MKQVTFVSFFRACLVAGAITLSACGSQRAPIPPGTIPQQTSLPVEDEAYGQEVLESLTARYALDTNDSNINRVRDLVARLTEAGKSGHNPWHPFVLVDDSLKNAAATRGNYIFVWTGMLRAVRDDDELATILAHEIGHVLAGHTEPDPAEEVNQILAEIAGATAGQVVGGAGYYGVSSLTEMLVGAALQALLVNPDAQRKELEADHIGLFLMAEAGFDPKKAVAFWERVKSDPDFGNASLGFLSSHPSSDERVTALTEYLPEAAARFRGESTGAGRDFAFTGPVPKELPGPKVERWKVTEDEAAVYSRPTDNGKLLHLLPYDTEVEVVGLEGRWLEISSPVRGYVRGRDLAPAP